MSTVATSTTLTTSLDKHTYLPDPHDSVTPVYDFMTKLDETGRDRPAERYLLAGSTPGEQVELPAEVYRVLRQVIEAMQQNLAVTVAPTTQTLTTQQAADLLGVSRPTLVRLCDEGKLVYERPGAHRRIKLTDLLAYRAVMREQQYAALADTAVDPQDEEDLEDTLKRLREARRTAAQRRRSHAQA